MTAIRLICLFFALFLFSNFANAGSGCAVGTSGAISEVVICAVDNGKSNLEIAATGLISISALMMGIYVITSALKK